jgi:hypothetical protein
VSPVCPQVLGAAQQEQSAYDLFVSIIFGIVVMLLSIVTLGVLYLGIKQARTACIAISSFCAASGGVGNLLGVGCHLLGDLSDVVGSNPPSCVLFGPTLHPPGAFLAGIDIVRLYGRL